MFRQITARLQSGSPARRRLCFLLLFGLFLLPTGITSRNAQANSPHPLIARVLSPRPQQPTALVIVLELGKPVERELVGGQAHFYQITLSAGQFASLTLEQGGLDLEATLFAPDGRELKRCDGRWHGPESISLLAATDGAYRLVVRTLLPGALRGTYELKLNVLRGPEPAAHSRLTAEELATAAKKLLLTPSGATLRQAREQYEKALPLWREVGDRTGEAQTLNSLGFIHNALGEQPQALAHYRQALALRQELNDLAGTGETLHNIAAVHSALGEKTQALQVYLQSLPLKRAAHDRFGEAFTLTNMASIYASLGQSQTALETYHEVLPLWRAIGSRPGGANALTNLGALYSLLGEKQQALDHHNQALALSKAAADKRGQAYATHNLGRTYDESGEKEAARAHYLQSLPLFRETADSRGEATALHNLGIVSVALGEKQAALDYYTQALTLWRKVNDRLGEANTTLNLGRLYDELGQKEKAAELYRQVLPVLQQAKDRRAEGAALHNLGALYSATGERQKALELANQALLIWREIGDRSSEAATLAQIARVERALERLPDAHVHIEQALAITEALRGKITSPALRTTFFTSTQEHYEFQIALLMQRARRDRAGGFEALALQASERARARTLLELLTEADADLHRDLPPALSARLRLLQQQINVVAEQQARLFNRAPTKEQAEASQRRLAELFGELEQVEVRIRQSSPRYAALKFPQPLSLTELQQQVLDADTLLLEYKLGEERSYLWAVTPTTITSHELPGRAALEESLKRLSAQLTERAREKGFEEQRERQARFRQADEAYLREAAALSRTLLSPVAAQLGRKRLLIVGDGALHTLSFAALPVPEVVPKKMQTRTRDYTPLIVEHELVYLPSVSTLAVLRNQTAGRAPTAKTVALLADPVFDASDERVLSAATAPPAAVSANHGSRLSPGGANAQRRLRGAETTVIPRLKYTGREATAITAFVPAAQSFLALGFAANRAAALAPGLGQYRYVHFATHGLFDSERPELSGLLLSLVDEQGREQEGFLSLQDIYNLRLPAEMVVLSACETAQGKLLRGEGLIGLTRGFMHAGAPRVVTSLWKVNDQVTAELMKRFYQGMLRQRRRPAAALRAAQISLVRKRAAPYYWAAFTLQGEWR